MHRDNRSQVDNALRFLTTIAITIGLLTSSTPSFAQKRTVPRVGHQGILLESADYRLRLVTVAAGLSHPWSLALLPDGDILVTERSGQLRLIQDGVLSPNPIPGVPPVHAYAQVGLMDVVLHPQFNQNQILYLTYTKPSPEGPRAALARARFHESPLTEVKDIFVSTPWPPETVAAVSRVAFDHNGILFMTVGGAVLEARDTGQDPNDYRGKV